MSAPLSYFYGSAILFVFFSIQRPFPFFRRLFLCVNDNSITFDDFHFKSSPTPVPRILATEDETQEVVVAVVVEVVVEVVPKPGTTFEAGGGGGIVGGPHCRSYRVTELPSYEERTTSCSLL